MHRYKIVYSYSRRTDSWASVAHLRDALRDLELHKDDPTCLSVVITDTLSGRCVRRWSRPAPGALGSIKVGDKVRVSSQHVRMKREPRFRECEVSRVTPKFVYLRGERDKFYRDGGRRFVPAGEFVDYDVRIVMEG